MENERKKKNSIFVLNNREVENGERKKKRKIRSLLLTILKREGRRTIKEERKEMKESVARLKKKLAGGVRVGSRIDGQSRLASRVRALRPSVATRMPRDTLASIVQARVPCRSCDIARHRSISRTPSRPDIRIPIR